MRDHWSTRIGIVLAIAGSAVGLGNFLRFPAKAVLNGGGAFMLPYFIAFILLALPLMMIEMAIGRYGGKHGFSSMPGIMQVLLKSPKAKWLGVIGVVLPLLLASYYVYIESWCFAYAWYSLTGALYQTTTSENFREFLQDYQNPASGHFIDTYIFFIIAFSINFLVVWNGIKKGIERLCLIAMPLLCLLAIFLFIRIFTLDTADPIFSDRSLTDALQFIWQPDFAALSQPKLWMEAASQIFFSTSVGFGVVATYSSYLKRRDDIALSALSSCSTNEFFEIVFGASLVIPVAFLFFGASGATEVAQSGIFNIGFVTMPMIFSKMQFGALFSFAWYALLAISAITSSISLIKPYTTFLENDLSWKGRKALITTIILLFILAQPSIWFCHHGAIDEVDYWCGNFLIIVFALILTISFFWFFGTRRAVIEILRGSLIKIPRSFWFICKYITPAMVAILFISCCFTDFADVLLMRNVSDENLPYIYLVRGVILTVVILTCYFARKLPKEMK